MSNVPSPPTGYEGYIFENFAHLIRVLKLKDLHDEIRLVTSWIWWRFWKNHNAFLFENLLFLVDIVVEKAFEEVNHSISFKAIFSLILHT